MKKPFSPATWKDPRTDLDALRAFDSNKDGVLDANDSFYTSLKIGRDYNQNGHFEANEVGTLAQLGIARINLYDGIQNLQDPDAPAEIAPGVVEFNAGSFVRANGTTGRFADAGLEERSVAAAVYNDGIVGMASFGNARSWVQLSTAAVSLDLSTATYAGHTNFVEFYGNAGNDLVHGSGADDYLFGGGGSDSLYGNGGDDTIVVDAADLAAGWFSGGDGRDTLLFDDFTNLSLDASSRSFEIIVGGTGNDTLWVSVSVLDEEGVFFNGFDGNDSLTGGDGGDILVGGAGADSLNGGVGDDMVVADQDDLAAGVLLGGAGWDNLDWESSSSLNLDAYAHGFEVVFGGFANDYLQSTSTDYRLNPVVFYGQGGNDTLIGGSGDDYLVGGPGSDSFSGGGGDDIMVIDRYDSLLSINEVGGSYEKGDTLIFDDTTAVTITNLYTMNIRGAVGGDGNDTIYASRTDNNYWQQKSDNFLAGGRGDDYLYGGAGQDVYTWNPGDGNDTFVDRDYGEWRGDIVYLGDGVAAAEVTIRNVGGIQSLFVGGVGAGSMRLIGFSGSGAVDKLIVGGTAYDLNSLLNSASPYGNEGILLTTRLPASYGSGGGGYTGGGGGDPTGTGGGSTGGGGPTGGGGGSNPIPPIVFDLDGDGFELIAAKKSGVFFDWNGDGIKDETGWVAPDDGLLVLDWDGDGQITRPDEIAFGTTGGKKDPFTTDLQGLARYDTNENGSLDSGDAAFAKFGIWRDLDSDAVVDAGELQSLDSAGLRALALTGYLTGDQPNGRSNIIYATTDAVFADRDVRVADAFLVYKPEALQGNPHNADAHFAFNGAVTEFHATWHLAPA
ncbi:MAG TPA: calcium-binding protein [Allosphingosinicella sp.]